MCCVCVYLNYIPLPTQVSDSAAAYVLTSTYTFFQQKNKNVTAPCTFTHIFSNIFKLFDQLQQENRTSAVLLLGVVTALLYVFFFQQLLRPSIHTSKSVTKTYRGDISQYLRVGHTILIQPQMPAFVKWCNEVIVHIFLQYLQ